MEVEAAAQAYAGTGDSQQLYRQVAGNSSPNFVSRMHS